MSETKSSDFVSVGNEVGGFLGGVLNPVIGGTTQTQVTEKPSASSSTTTIVIVIAVVGILAVVGYMALKKMR